MSYTGLRCPADVCLRACKECAAHVSFEARVDQFMNTTSTASVRQDRTGRSRPAALLTVLLALLLTACGDPPWNNPHPPAPDGLMTYQSVMTPSPPKHLDPAISYASDESLYIMQIYEPPMGYHFLKRPYELLPAALTQFPAVTYLDAEGAEVQ